jgi:tyrosinase
MALRRNIKRLDDKDRERLVKAFKAMKRSGVYDEFVKLYAAYAEGIQGGPAFLPWHRALLIEFEVELQRALDDQSFGLPYWDWTADAALPDPSSSPVWSPDFLGGSGTPVHAGPFAGKSWVAVDGAGAPTGGLARALGDAEGVRLPTREAIEAILTLSSYDTAPWDDSSQGSFRNALERLAGPTSAQNTVHGWVGGHMCQGSVAPNDPVFWLHCCNMDRIWSEWQRTRPIASYVPIAGARRGHNLTDRLLPWDGQGGRVAHTPQTVLMPATYAYDQFYAIRQLVVVIKTHEALFAGTDDPISLTLFGSNAGVAFELDGAHCDHEDPFETGQTDTFTFTEVFDRANGAPISAESLTYFTLRKGSTTRTGDWRIAAIRIQADNLVLYDNPSLDVKLVQSEPRFTDNLKNVAL